MNHHPKTIEELLEIRSGSFIYPEVELFKDMARRIKKLEGKTNGRKE